MVISLNLSTLLYQIWDQLVPVIIHSLQTTRLSCIYWLFTINKNDELNVMLLLKTRVERALQICVTYTFSAHAKCYCSQTYISLYIPKGTSNIESLCPKLLCGIRGLKEREAVNKNLSRRNNVLFLKTISLGPWMMDMKLQSTLNANTIFKSSTLSKCPVLWL